MPVKHSNPSAPLNKTDGTAIPGVNDDSTAGFSKASFWIHATVSPVEVYACVDATAGAAIWVKTTLTIDELGSMALQNANAVAITGGAIDGTTIGATTPAAVTATGVVAPTLDTAANAAGLTLNIPVSGTDAATHTLALQIDGDAGIEIIATGDGAAHVGAKTINIGKTAEANVVSIGGATALVDITDAHWSITDAGVLSIVSMGANWTNSGRTVADAGILTTVDINGGTIDGATIGGATPAPATVSTLASTSARTIAVTSIATGSTGGVTAAAATHHAVEFTGTTTHSFNLSALENGREFRFCNISTGAVTINRAGADTFSTGGTTVVLAAGDSCIITGSTNVWMVF
jgi:hypothetical protein